VKAVLNSWLEEIVTTEMPEPTPVYEGLYNYEEDGL
jgi:hypothetical protein